ncbi:DUF4199 domain-containing protein [Mucilaginibacter litoreus]|uniref:DUF4199 domain-containing protein n=1 Tax=Mucilaginibacter litoreus TaxID=1048221 RepID=A0ABW3AS71_9SPHI
METVTPNPTKIATKWALIYVLVSIVITYTFQFLDIDQNSGAKWIGYLPFIAFCFLAQKEYKEQLGGFITFGQAFNPGFRYALFGGLLLGVFVFIYLGYLSPEMLVKGMEQQESQMAEKGMSQEQIDKAIEMGKKLGPMLGGVFTALSTLIFGCIVSLVGAAILKKERTAYDFPDDTQPTEPTV